MNQHPLWPTWPFTKLTPDEMAVLLQEMKLQRIEELEEALL